MKNDLLLQMFWTFAMLSLAAVGGVTAIMPELHAQIVETNHWMRSSTFAHLFALAQVAPGPNLIVVSLLGYHIAGWSGLAAATLGFLLPATLLTMAVTHLMGRYDRTKEMAVFKAGLLPVALGLFAAGSVTLCTVADTDALGFGLSVFGVFFTLAFDSNPLWAIAVGAAIGSLVGVFSA